MLPIDNYNSFLKNNCGSFLQDGLYSVELESVIITNNMYRRIEFSRKVYLKNIE